MKARLVTAIGMALSLVASLSFAGDYHIGSTLICSDCHVMHFSQAHSDSANGNGFYTPLGGSTPHEFLLRNDINDLCLSCHDGKAFAPDVFEANSNSYVRQAGALNKLAGGGLYPPTTGHTLGSPAVAPGSNPSWSNATGLNCADCHNVHGARSTQVAPASYRNLRGPGSIEVTYSRLDVEGSNLTTKWVFEDASTGVNANHYGYNHVTFNEPDVLKSRYAEFCKGCHTNFHGDVGQAEIGGVAVTGGYADFVRHPALTSNIGAVGGGHSSLSRFAGKTNQVQAMSPNGTRAGSYTTANTDLTPSCMSCHKGHGNQNAFGLIYMLGSGATVDEQGDGVTNNARNTCRQCHGQGGSSTAF